MTQSSSGRGQTLSRTGTGWGAQRDSQRLWGTSQRGVVTVFGRKRADRKRVSSEVVRSKTKTGCCTFWNCQYKVFLLLHELRAPAQNIDTLHWRHAWEERMRSSLFVMARLPSCTWTYPVLKLHAERRKVAVHTSAPLYCYLTIGHGNLRYRENFHGV